MPPQRPHLESAYYLTLTVIALPPQTFQFCKQTTMRATEFLLLSLAAASPVTCANAATPDGPFQLYAYGEDVGGLVLFSDGGRYTCSVRFRR